MYDYTTRDVVKGEASRLPIEKSIGVQQCMGYAPEKHSNRGEGVED